jgi:hypothetical protein
MKMPVVPAAILAFQCLTEPEQESLVQVLRAARKDHTTLANRAWLSQRPEREQMAVQRIVARFNDFTLEAS